MSNAALLRLILRRCCLAELGIDVMFQFREISAGSPEFDVSTALEKHTMGICSPVGLHSVPFNTSSEPDGDDISIIDIDCAPEEAVLWQLSRMEAEANILDVDGKARLSRLLSAYRNRFRIGWGPQPPVLVAARSIELLPESRSMGCRQRRYSPLHAKFLSEATDMLCRFDCLRQNDRAWFASAAMTVPKPGRKDEYRLVVDLRFVNSITTRYLWPAWDPASASARLTGSTIFSTLDADNGYWQIPIDDATAEIFSLMTHDGVYSSTRVLQASVNGCGWFQAAMF
jgi:hypothetical protein